MDESTKLRHALPRIRQILSVFRKNKVFKALRSRERDYKVLGKALRVSFEELGPFFIKLGQFLSVNYLTVPAELRKEFEKLQNNVPEFPYEEAKTIIEEEFDTNMRSLFRKFDKKPIAAASLAQVYKAKLHSGEEVAVKIQRPGVEEIIKKDIGAMRWICKLIDRKLKKQNVDIYKILRELEDFLTIELDFEQEVIHIDLFRAQELKKYEKIPEVYLHTRKVIIEEFIKGIKLSDFTAIHKAKIDKEVIIDNFSKSMFYHIFRDGLFHGDPHPANIVVLKDGRVAYLDFGVVGKISSKTKKAYIGQYKSVLANEPEHFLEEFLYANDINPNDVTNYDKIMKELKEEFDKHAKKNTNAYDCIVKANEILAINKVPETNSFLVILRGFVALNDVVRKYGFSDKRFENLVQILAGAEHLPFSNTLGPEIMEIGGEKSNDKNKLFADLQFLLNTQKTERSHLPSRRKEILKKKSVAPAIAAILLGGVFILQETIQTLSGVDDLTYKVILGGGVVLLALTLWRK